MCNRSHAGHGPITQTDTLANLLPQLHAVSSAGAQMSEVVVGAVRMQSMVWSRGAFSMDSGSFKFHDHDRLDPETGLARATSCHVTQLM